MGDDERRHLLETAELFLQWMKQRDETFAALELITLELSRTNPRLNEQLARLRLWIELMKKDGRPTETLARFVAALDGSDRGRG